MSDANNLITFTLKASINKQKTRVLFAEIGNDFVNLLFSFLILPLVTIMQVFERHYGDKTPLVIGSLYTLYNGCAKLGDWRFKSVGYKPSIFERSECYLFPHLNTKIKSGPFGYSLGKAYFPVYSIFTESFIICDDLRIVPNVKGSIVTTLNNVGVDMADMDGFEMREVTFGLNEVMDFLKGLMISQQPLTDSMRDTCLKFELQSSYLGIPLDQIQKEEAANLEKMILKVTFQASTKKFLFVQAEKDFASFIINLLKIPLGLVDLHLGGNTFFKNLGNLYKSIVDLLGHEHLKDGYTRNDLMKSNTFHPDHISTVFTDRSRMYMVTDDCTVTDLFVSSAFSLLNQMKIHSTDVEEMELRIGLEEARIILRASLISTCALSDVITPLLKKQLKPKQEH